MSWTRRLPILLFFLGGLLLVGGIINAALVDANNDSLFGKLLAGKPLLEPKTPLFATYQIDEPFAQFQDLNVKGFTVYPDDASLVNQFSRCQPLSFAGTSQNINSKIEVYNPNTDGWDEVASCPTIDSLWIGSETFKTYLGKYPAGTYSFRVNVRYIDDTGASKQILEKIDGVRVD